jgi:hypothetical protein
MRRLLISSAFLVLAQVGVASAAGPFDGAWSGEVAGSIGPVRSCTAIKGTVTDSDLHAVITSGKFKPSDVAGQDCGGRQLFERGRPDYRQIRRQ